MFGGGRLTARALLTLPSSHQRHRDVDESRRRDSKAPAHRDPDEDLIALRLFGVMRDHLRQVADANVCGIGNAGTIENLAHRFERGKPLLVMIVLDVLPAHERPYVSMRRRLNIEQMEIHWIA